MNTDVKNRLSAASHREDAKAAKKEVPGREYTNCQQKPPCKLSYIK